MPSAHCIDILICHWILVTQGTTSNFLVDFYAYSGMCVCERESGGEAGREGEKS